MGVAPTCPALPSQESPQRWFVAVVAVWHRVRLASLHDLSAALRERKHLGVKLVRDVVRVTPRIAAVVKDRLLARYCSIVAVARAPFEGDAVFLALGRQLPDAEKGQPEVIVCTDDGDALLEGGPVRVHCARH